MKRTRTPPWPPITMAAIRRYARQVAERFHPDKIILFGSFAYGTPNPDSDVDLMVIMPGQKPGITTTRIRWDLPAPFPMDMLVCSRAEWDLRVEDNESFIRTIRTKGKVLYEARDADVGHEGRGRSPRRGDSRRKKAVAP